MGLSNNGRNNGNGNGKNAEPAHAYWLLARAHIRERHERDGTEPGAGVCVDTGAEFAQLKRGAAAVDKYKLAALAYSGKLAAVVDAAFAEMQAGQKTAQKAGARK